MELGRLAYEAYFKSLGQGLEPIAWDQLSPGNKSAWHAAAEAARQVQPVSECEAPLTVNLVNGAVALKIGTNTLAQACSHLYLTQETPATILDANGFAQDVIAALLHEEEDGSSPLTNLLDAAFESAVGEGSEHIRLASEEDLGDDVDDDE